MLRRPRHRVETADSQQHQRAADDVEDEVPDRRRGVAGAAVEGDEHVAGHQHHLEPDEEVEQVAGEEGAGDAQEEAVKERVVVHALVVPLDEDDGERYRRETHDRGDDEHERREPVEDEGDPVGCRVTAQLVGRPPGASGPSTSRHTAVATVPA